MVDEDPPGDRVGLRLDLPAGVFDPLAVPFPLLNLNPRKNRLSCPVAGVAGITAGEDNGEAESGDGDDVDAVGGPFGWGPFVDWPFRDP